MFVFVVIVYLLKSLKHRPYRLKVSCDFLRYSGIMNTHTDDDTNRKTDARAARVGASNVA